MEDVKVMVIQQQLKTTWHPRFVKDIQLLERVQRAATIRTYIDDFISDYRDRFASLKLLH